MAERYTKIFSLKQDLYQATCPVLIRAGALLLDTTTAKALAQLKIENISASRIKSVKVNFKCINSNGEVIDDVLHTYGGLDVGRDVIFGTQTPVYLFKEETREFSVRVCEVEYNDSTLWNDNGAEQTALPIQESIKLSLSPIAYEAYTEIHGEALPLKFEKHEDLWLCSCGACNRTDEGVCHKCRTQRSVMENIDQATLEKKYYDIIESKKAESLKTEIAEKANAKTCKILAAVFMVVGLMEVFLNRWLIEYSKLNMDNTSYKIFALIGSFAVIASFAFVAYSMYKFDKKKIHQYSVYAFCGIDILYYAYELLFAYPRALIIYIIIPLAPLSLLAFKHLFAQNSEKLWFIPAVLTFLKPISIFTLRWYFQSFYYSLIYTLPMIAAYGILGYWSFKLAPKNK